MRFFVTIFLSVACLGANGQLLAAQDGISNPLDFAQSLIKRCSARFNVRPDFCNALKPFDVEIFSVQRSVDHDSILDFSFSDRIASVMHSLLAKSPEGEIPFELFKNDGANLEIIEGIPIPVYKQIARDFNRPPTVIYFEGQQIFSTLNYSAEDNVYRVLAEAFRAMKLALDRQQLNEMPEDVKWELIHQVLASRTQTFSVEAVNFFIKKLLAPGFSECDVGFGVGGTVHTIQMVEGAIIAKTVHNFHPINRHNPEEAFPEVLVVDRALTFLIMGGKFEYNNELFRVSRRPI